MKTPLWFPQSFFARTLWLVLIVVLFSKALTLVYLLMNEDVLVDRQYSHGVALTLRAYWAADEENRDKIAEAAGLIRVTGSGADKPRKKRSQSIPPASAAAAPPSGVGASGSRNGTFKCTGPPPLPRLRVTACTIVWRT